MPASPSFSVHDDTATSSLRADEHSSRSYHPISSQRRLPKLTLARLTFFVATLGLGIPKAVTSTEGQETVTNILDLNLGVIWPCVAYCLSILENECPQVAPWFLEYDLLHPSPIILDLLLSITGYMVAEILFYELMMTLFSGPTFYLVLPFFTIGLGLLAGLVLVVVDKTREYRPRARTLLIVPHKLYRKVRHLVCNIVNRYHHRFITIHKISFPIAIFLGLLIGPLEYLSLLLPGGRWIVQVDAILTLGTGLLSALCFMAILFKSYIDSSPNFGPPSSTSLHECSVPLEEIVVVPARCEINPVRSGSDNSSTDIVSESTRISTTNGPFLSLNDGQSGQKADKVHNAEAGPSPPSIPPLPSAIIRLTRVESECGLLSSDTPATGVTQEHSLPMSTQRHSSHSLSAMPDCSPAETHRRCSICTQRPATHS